MSGFNQTPPQPGSKTPTPSEEKRQKIEANIKLLECLKETKGLKGVLTGYAFKKSSEGITMDQLTSILDDLKPAKK